MHVRKQIRDGVVALLQGLPTTGDNVFDSRGFEIEQEDFPFWSVYTATEEGEVAAMGGVLARVLQVELVGGVREADGPTAYAKMDAMLEEAETALSDAAMKSQVPGIQGFSLANVELIEAQDQYDRLIVGVEVSFACEYFTADGAPGAFG